MWARVVAGRVLTTSGFGRAAGGSTAGKELSPRRSLSTYSALDSSCRLTLGSLKSGLLELCAFEIFLILFHFISNATNLLPIRNNFVPQLLLLKRNLY